MNENNQAIRTLASEKLGGHPSRRVLLGVATAMASAGVVSSAVAQEAGEHDHGPAVHKALIDSAHHCVMTGQICLDHCFDSFKAGDTTLAECAVQVQELAAVCQALAQLASNESKNLVSLAKVTIDVCNDCEAECRKHEANHVQCKDCADACAACREECEKITA